MTKESEIEREAIVRWLREEEAMRYRLANHARDKDTRLYNFHRGVAIGMAADAIQLGDHLKERG